MLIKTKVLEEKEVELDLEFPLYFKEKGREQLHLNTHVVCITEQRQAIYAKREIIVSYSNISDSEIAGILKAWEPITEKEFFQVYVEASESFDTALNHISL